MARPLAQAIGISSQIAAAIWVRPEDNLAWEMLGCPELYHWNGNFESLGEAKFADGCLTDNDAILPALRRGVRRLIIGDASTVPHPEFGLTGGDNWQIAAYFGAVTDNEDALHALREFYPTHSPAVVNRHVQVFETAQFEGLETQVKELFAAGSPVAVRLKLKVLPNAAQGVTGGYEVDTLWIFNGGFGNWWHDVHEDSQAELNSLKKDCNFPNISCLTTDYTPEQTGYLANLAAWNIFEIREQIKSFLD